MHADKPMRLLRSGEAPYVPCYLNWRDAVDADKQTPPVQNLKYKEDYLLRCRLDAQAEAIDQQQNRVPNGLRDQPNYQARQLA